MEELTEWLDANKISFKMIDNEVIEIENHGKQNYVKRNILSWQWRNSGNCHRSKGKSVQKSFCLF